MISKICDTSLGTAGLACPWWLGYVDIAWAVYLAAAGGALVTLRIVLAVREYRKDH